MTFYNNLIHDYKIEKKKMSSKKSSNIRYWLTLITHLADTSQLWHNLDFDNPKLFKIHPNSLPSLYLHQ